MIYVAEILDRRFIKVGFSEGDRVAARLATLQTGCPFEILPVFTVEGTLKQEKSLHAGLRTALGRIRVPSPPNEWYPGRCPFIVEFMEHLRSGFDMGFSFLQRYSPAVKQPSPKVERQNVSPHIKWPKSSMELPNAGVWG